jgi:stage III sporulation protein AB
MLILKIIVIAAGFGVCAYGGYRYSQRYVSREKYFAEILEFCAGLCADISFLRLSLYPILEKYTGSFKSFLCAQLAGASALLDDNKSIDEATLKNYVPQGFLSGEEFETVIRFFNILGKSDADNQEASIESFKAVFRKYHADAAEKKKKYSSLYWKLGLLAGAALTVFVI